MNIDSYIAFPLVFALGLIFGSHANVIIFRYPLALSTVTPRSQCLNCNRTLSWYENLPLLSYLALRGRCRSCKRRISFIYPLVEFATGALFLASYVNVGLSQELISLLILGALTFPMIIIDLKFQKIPNQLTGLLWLLVLTELIVQSFVADSFQGLTSALTQMFVVAAVFLTIFLVTHGRGIGMGDVKLAPALALVTAQFGVGTTVSAFILSFLIAGILAIALLMLKKVRRKTRIAFGPFLILGTWISILLSEEMKAQLLLLWGLKFTK
jgi:hypothetical protein